MKEQNEKIEQKTSWYAKSVDFAFEKTKSSKEGLTTEEAEKRLKEKVTVFTRFHNLIRKAKMRIVKGIPPLIYLTNLS